jgi:ABC-type multidrug transport system fused ATPase/permease subunit
MIRSTDKSPLQSKKWIAMMIGVACAMLVFIASLVVIMFNTEAASHVVTLANNVVVFLGMMVSILITGQSAVDWRQTTTQSAVTVDKQETFIAKIEQDVRQKNETVTRYADKYRDDDSYRPINPAEETWK